MSSESEIAKLPPIDQSYSFEGNISPRRQIERLAFVFGLGGAAILGYCVYRHFKERNRQRESQLPNDLINARLANQAEHGEGTRVSATEKGPSKRIGDEGDSSFTTFYVDETNNNNVVNNNNLVSSLSENAQVVLHQCPRGYLTPCIAPFPLKLETFLRVAGIPYNVDFSVSPDDGDVPWMTVAGEDIHESHECFSKLCEVFDINLDSKAQNSRMIACRLVGIMLDSHIYWGIALWRWVYDQGQSVPKIQPLSDAGIATIPDIGASVSRAAYYHGLGRLSPKQVMDLILKDLGDLSSALGKHQYFLGESPGEVDCGAFAMLAQMIWNMPGSPYEAGVKQYRNLVDFVLRMRDNFWPDWQKLLQVPGQENVDGAAINPGSEFLHRRLLSSGSSQDSQRSASTVTLRAEESNSAYYNNSDNQRENSRIKFSSRSPAARSKRSASVTGGGVRTGILKSTSSNEVGHIKIVPLTRKQSSRNPFEEAPPGNFQQVTVQYIPQGIFKSKIPSNNMVYSPEIDNPPPPLHHPGNYNYQQQPNPGGMYPPDLRRGVYSQQGIDHDPQQNTKHVVSGIHAMAPNHGNVMQRINMQNHNPRPGMGSNGNFYPLNPPGNQQGYPPENDKIYHVQYLGYNNQISNHQNPGMGREMSGMETLPPQFGNRMN